MPKMILKSRHRLLCGDSTNPEHVARLMGGAQADLCFTSPPYNLGNNHHTAGKKTQAYNDALPENEYQTMQEDVLDLIAAHVTGDLFYQHKNRIKEKSWLTPLDWIRRPPWRIVQEIIWINGGPNMDPCRFYPQTERIWWMTRTGTTTQFNNTGRFTDWWQVQPVGTNGEHTRAFPVELVVRVLMSVDSRSVYEPFCGSGTTIIAAEQLQRRSFGMEIAPQYCDIILRRFENLTGEKPVLSPSAPSPAPRRQTPAATSR